MQDRIGSMDAYDKMVVLEKEYKADDEQEKVYSEKEYQKEKVRLTLKNHWAEHIITVVYMLIVLHAGMYIYRACKALYYVSTDYIPLNPVTSFFWLLLPFGIWMWSTAYDEFNFHNKKLFGMYCSIVNLCLFLLNAIQSISTKIFTPLLKKITITQYITENMVVGLAQIIIFMCSFIPVFFLGYWIFSAITSEGARETILSFRVLNYIDVRKYKAYAYDMKIVRRLDTGEVHTIKEKDRSLHTVYDGVTGTGKTSSCMVTAAADDLDQKVKNEAEQRKRIVDMLQKGTVRLKVPFTDETFTIDKVEALCKEAEKELDVIKKYIRSCGMTILAPNSSLTDEIYELAEARGISVNRVDPILTKDGCRKKGFKGFNPLYISPTLSKHERNLEVVRNARTCADTLQAIYEMSGKGDPYFTSLNRNVTTCVTIIVLLTWESLHKKRPDVYHESQPTLVVIQDIINNFQRVRPYRDEYMELTTKYTDEQRGYKKEAYKFVIDLIDGDLLGEGAAQMQNQARGLRNIINEFLANPLFRDALCCENTVDMDAMLADGQITVVNYALELGRNDAIAFGLFFALSFNNAVLRRPVEGRIPHFYDIDEYPLLLHPSMEQCFTLFRQYNVPMGVAIQTLDQMEKSEMTRYLKGVLLGNCAHQFIFGRISTTEMKLYEELGGKRKEVVEQDTVTETALSMENTAKTFSKRLSSQDVSVIQGGRMRNLNFQEVTVFTVDDGSQMEPFFGKVSFLKPEKRLKRERFVVDWSRFYNTLPKELLTAYEEGMYENSLVKDGGKVRFSNTEENEKPEEKQEIFLSSGYVTITNNEEKAKEPESDFLEKEITQEMEEGEKEEEKCNDEDYGIPLAML